LGPDWRPTIETREFVARVAEWLGLEIEDLRSRRRSRHLVRARELLMILGVERYGLKVKDLARELQKSPDGMTQTVARAARKRTKDNAFLVDLNKLDHSMAGAEE
jgi:chromosomal replication initiation ATPase DnaA